MQTQSRVGADAHVDREAWLKTVSPVLEEGLLGAVGGAGDGRVVCGRGLRAPLEPAEQVCACRVEQVIAIEAELVDEFERQGRTLRFGDGNAPVEGHDGRG